MILTTSTKPQPWPTWSKLAVIGVVTALGIVGIILATGAFVTANLPAETEPPPESVGARRSAGDVSEESPEMTTSETAATKRRTTHGLKKSSGKKEKPTTQARNKRKRITTDASSDLANDEVDINVTKTAKTKHESDSTPSHGEIRPPMTKRGHTTLTTVWARRVVPHNGVERNGSVASTSAATKQPLNPSWSSTLKASRPSAASVASFISIRQTQSSSVIRSTLGKLTENNTTPRTSQTTSPVRSHAHSPTPSTTLSIKWKKTHASTALSKPAPTPKKTHAYTAVSKSSPKLALKTSKMPPPTSLPTTSTTTALHSRKSGTASTQSTEDDLTINDFRD
ncbi:hypothetical protein MRX96_054259 [Rhipicephalus microplus]